MLNVMQSQIQDFISAARLRNATDEEIVKILLDQGWSLDVIQINLGSPSSINGLTPPKPNPTEQEGLGMWDAFQHVLMFISLYVMATTIAIFLNYYIDFWQIGMPVDLGMYGNPSSPVSSSIISGLSAALLVSYPLFSFFFISINKRKFEFPEIVKLSSRKILIYLTLTVTFIITLCHLIYIVFMFLIGFMSINLFLHFMVTLSVSGSIFVYFINEVRHDRDKIR